MHPTVKYHHRHLTCTRTCTHTHTHTHSLTHSLSLSLSLSLSHTHSLSPPAPPQDTVRAPSGARPPLLGYVLECHRSRQPLHQSMEAHPYQHLTRFRQGSGFGFRVYGLGSVHGSSSLPAPGALGPAIERFCALRAPLVAAPLPVGVSLDSPARARSTIEESS